MNNIVKKSVYLTNLFVDMKSDTKWNEDDLKVTLLVLSKLSHNKIYLPDYYNDNENSFDMKLFEERILAIPREYIITRSEFADATGVSSSHVARNINSMRRSLVKKIIDTPHPVESNDTMSGESISWFSKISYSNKNGEIIFKINEDALGRLVAFVKYTKVDFSNIVNMNNGSAIYYYLFFKILMDASKTKKMIMSLLEFKERINLSGKYIKLSHFKEKVLDVIKFQICKYTDINFDYELIKEGRAFTKIKFIFDYKPEIIEPKKNKTYAAQNKKIHVLKDDMSSQYIDESSPFEHILTGWSIRAKKVVELEETYSLDVIQSAIELTLEKEKAGEIKTTKAAIFLGILENKQQASDEVFEREQQQLAKQDEKDHLKALGAEYDAIQKVISYNDDEISSYLSAKAMGATYEISPALNEQLLNMSCVDAEKFKGFRPKLAVLHNGYFDINQDKKVFPNLYDLLILI
jgi:plasmid replication initiation protein